MFTGFPLPRDYEVCSIAAGDSISRAAALLFVCKHLVLRGGTQLWVTLPHAGTPGGL